MRIVLITNNVVVNVIEALTIPLDNFGFDYAIESLTANTGDAYVNGEFIKPPSESTPIEQPDPPVIVPEISAFQAKAALATAGYYDQVEAYMATADTVTRLRWQEAPSFRRNNESLIAIATSIGITESELDALFALGATITL